MHAANIAGHAQRKREGVIGDAAPAVDGHDHDGLGDFGGNDGLVESSLPLHAVVMALDGAHEHDHDNDQQGRDPCALHKLCHQDDGGGNAGGDRAQPVDEHAHRVAALALPVHHHAGLR